MSGLVLDCSVAVAWCFEDEASAATDALMARVRDEGAVVPELWHLEVASVLVQAERRKRIDSATMEVRLETLAILPIVTDRETTPRAWGAIVDVARDQGLTIYDATYAELARRSGFPLATKDAELRRAARRMGVEVVP